MMPTKHRYPSGYLLDIGSTRVLVDCGAPTVSRLVEKGVVFRDIEAFCVSHFHTDHFGGFLPFIHARWVDDRMTRRQHTPLTVFGPASIEERWKKLREVSWPEPEEEFPLTFHPGPASSQVGALKIEMFAIQHVPWFASVGYRFTHEKSVLVYTGDVGSAHPWDDLVARARGATVLLIEAAASAPAPNHLTIDQVLRLQKEAEVRQVIVTHVREQQLPTLTARLANERSVRIAEDGMTIKIG